MKKVLVLINHNAGRKKAIKYKKQVLEFLIKNKFEYKFVDIDEFYEINKNNFDTFFVLGGDGTINKVLPYLKNKTLGIIPTGTANLLSSKLNINNLKQALSAIKENKIIEIDVLNINSSPCILRFGTGYDSDIIAKTPQSLKNKFGYFAYFLMGIFFALNLKLKEYELSFDNEILKIRASCIIVANSANMFKNLISIAKNSSLTDNKFEVFILKTKNPIIFFFELLKIIFKIKWILIRI